MDITPQIIIDDVDASIALLTDFGRSVVAPSARRIRDTILILSAIQRLPILSYQRFVDWAGRRASSNLTWLVIDPLFPTAILEAPFLSLRISRVLSKSNTLQLDSSLPLDFDEQVRGLSVGILDDAVSTGQTLTYLSDRIEQAGGELKSMIVATTTAEGRKRCRLRTEQWAQFTEADYRTAHLRDACACLPFAGKRLHSVQPISSGSRSLDARVPAMVIGGAVWQHLMVQPAFRHIIAQERRALANRFSASLGRAATVADIGLLGKPVAVPLWPAQHADWTSPLVDLLG